MFNKILHCIMYASGALAIVAKVASIPVPFLLPVAAGLTALSAYLAKSPIDHG
jgi:hypothetical protein